MTLIRRLLRPLIQHREFMGARAASGRLSERPLREAGIARGDIVRLAFEQATTRRSTLRGARRRAWHRSTSASAPSRVAGRGRHGDDRNIRPLGIVLRQKYSCFLLLGRRLLMGVAALGLTLGSLPTTVPLVAATGVLVLIAGTAPASAQEGAICDWIRPLANGDRECLGYTHTLPLFSLALVEILGPDDPVVGSPRVCTSTTGSTPATAVECEESGLTGRPPIEPEGCGPFPPRNTIITTKCALSDDPELSSASDYVGPLFVPELSIVSDTLFDLEVPAVEDVLDLHQLPDADFDKVLVHARDDVRAMLFARLAGIAELDPADRTSEEQAVVDGFAAAIRDRRILAAELALEEYAEWRELPCFYVPPGDFTYDPGITCVNPLAGLFSTTPPPDAHEFQSYGAARAFDFMTDPKKGLLVAVATAVAFGKGANPEIAIAFGVGLVISAAVAYAIFANLAIIFPWSIGAGLAAFIAAETTTAAAAAAAATAASTVVGALAVVGAAGAVLVGLVIFVLSIINVVQWDEIPQKLEDAVAAAGQEVSLTQAVQAEDGKVIQEFYAAFIAATLPERHPAGPAPAATANDDEFSITDEQGDNGVVSPYIDFVSWNEADTLALGPLASARLSGGWFVVSGVVETDEGDEVPYEALSLRIPYEAWDGRSWTAWRLGKDFLHMRNGEDSDPEDPEDSFLSDELRFVDADGNNRIATVVSDTTPPVISPQVTGTLGDNDWYVSDVTLSWDVSDPESEIESQSTGCDTEQITTDVIAFMRTCEATSAGGTASQSVNLKRDATPPNIAATQSPPPNANGWNKTSPVTVEFSCDDASSGIASCSEGGTASGGGSGVHPIFLGEARDEAGNETSITVEVKIDTNPPTISGTAAPSANAAGWNNADVTVTFNCFDDLLGSGIASCTSPQTLSAEGGGQEVSGTAVDRADNKSSTTVSGINIDTTPPVVTLATPPDGATYVQNEVVLAQWTATDALSGIGTASGSAADGAAVDTTTAGAQSFTVMASDVADNASEVSHGYTVLSAAEAAATLVTKVETVVTDIEIQTSLTEQLQAAIASLDRSNQAAAQGQLGAFINLVEAQSGKKIAPADADALIADAQLVLGAMAPAS